MTRNVKYWLVLFLCSFAIFGSDEAPNAIEGKWRKRARSFLKPKNESDASGRRNRSANAKTRPESMRKFSSRLVRQETFEKLKGKEFYAARFDRVNFGDLKEVIFRQCTMDRCDFSNLRITGCKFVCPSINSCTFAGADISDTVFIEVDFFACNFALANLKKCTFRKCKNQGRKNYPLQGADKIAECEFIDCKWQRPKIIDLYFIEKEDTSSKSGPPKSS